MLRGASADAFGELEQKLRSTGTQADAASTGEELFGVVAVLRNEPALRRVATDSSVEGEAKADLVRTIFGATLGEHALDLLVDAVQRRWTVSWDLADSLEQLAVIALVRSVGKDGNRVGDELFAVVRLLETNGELRSALADTSRSAQDRSALLSGLLSGNVLPATLTLVEQAVAGGKGNVEKVLADYQHVAASAQDEMLAVVRTARELGDAELRRLSTALGQQYATTVHLHVVVDPALIGGVRIDIGDNRIDDARRRLVG